MHADTLTGPNNARSCAYLSLGDELHEGPAVFVTDQLHSQPLAGRQLVDALVPPRGAAAGRR